jgi:hypothetical protein
VKLLPSELSAALETQVPGNVFVTGDRVAGTIKSLNNARAKSVRLKIVDAYGRTVSELPPATLAGNAAGMPLPGEFGYYSVHADAPGYRSSSVASYAVIPDNRVPGKEPNSPFGVCCHWEDYWYKPMAGTVAKRLGIAWIRDGHHQDTPAPQGGYRIANEVGLCQMSITGYCPGSENEVRTDDGGYEFKDFMGRQGAYAKNVGSQVDWYDMCNEPVFAWS